MTSSWHHSKNTNSFVRQKGIGPEKDNMRSLVMIVSIKGRTKLHGT